MHFSMATDRPPLYASAQAEPGRQDVKTLPHQRFLLFLAVFVTAVPVLNLLRGLDFTLALVLGFDLAVLVFLATVAPLWLNAGAVDEIRLRAARDDGGRVLLLLMAVTALVVVGIAVALLVSGRDNLGSRDLLLVAGTLVLAWVFVNLVFAFHYAHLFYDQHEGADRGGLHFPECRTPGFADFCYFSLVIGMTCQTSDVAILTSGLRRVAMVQGFVAFIFNLGVMALTINVLAGVL